jgi:hypothetical protein
MDRLYEFVLDQTNLQGDYYQEKTLFSCRPYLLFPNQTIPSAHPNSMQLLDLILEHVAQSARLFHQSVQLVRNPLRGCPICAIERPRMQV